MRPDSPDALTDQNESAPVSNSVVRLVCRAGSSFPCGTGPDCALGTFDERRAVLKIMTTDMSLVVGITGIIGFVIGGIPVSVGKVFTVG